jgi:hypothetical protein
MSDEEGRRHPSKKLKHDDGRKHLSYVDVIVHKRKLEVNPERNGWICIEFKKRDNEDEKEWNKDEAKLADLTSRFDYQIGFFVILAEYRDEVEWKIFKNGRGLEFQAVPNEI